ncbi:venom carboxylesterase-6-like [Trichoplusia ni]|uniref:Venom carboxylesterase-6-like n=1 Tax=Trichoplusia ni TaxID=7111 RepID=A0A7E5VTN7_TRINI|nr:venom carboxylesterase-6-like [Trichoplusia ni]
MLLLFSIASVLSLALGQLQTPEVTIRQGKVIGSVASDGRYYEFHGIPYADSTSGIHRFKAPLPAPNFQSDFIANRKDIKCVRPLGVGYEGTEDCLVANIFTESISVTSQLPVMVWIKGKEFDKTHEEDLSFKNFVDKGIVVVSLNYRESVLGFLCLGTENAPGNAGLKDIIAGLKWVQENIAQFGGNPNEITLFGHGSGAAAVDLVTLSPMAEGLVHRAISQSGNAMAPWAVSRDNLKYAIQVAEGLGHVVTNVKELSNIFTRTSVAALMGIINELELTDNSLAFSPCIEKPDLENVEPFLTKTPKQIIDDGTFLQIPVIIGFVHNEGTIRAEEAFNDDWLTRMEESFTDFLQPDLQFSGDADEASVAERIKHFYFGDDSINLSHIGQYIKYHGHTMIMISSVREARNRASQSSVTTPTYLYQYSYKGTLGVELEDPLNLDSAAHSDELAYLFYTGTTGQAPERDLAVRDILVERWSNFAKTGEPTSTTSDIVWRPFTAVNSYFLHILADTDIGTRSSLESSLVNPYGTDIFFWEDIYSKHFLDAESSWVITDRNEDENDPTTAAPTTAAPPTDAPATDAPAATTPAPDGDATTEAPSSASTAVGYTLLIVTLFTLLSHLHSSQLLS